MKTKYYYKTLRGLFAANGIQEMRLRDYLTKSICSPKNGWITFTLSESADNELRLLFANAIGGEENQKKCAEILPLFANMFGGFKSAIVEKSGKGFRGYYRPSRPMTVREALFYAGLDN